MTAAFIPPPTSPPPAARHSTPCAPARKDMARGSSHQAADQNSDDCGGGARAPSPQRAESSSPLSRRCARIRSINSGSSMLAIAVTATGAAGVLPGRYHESAVVFTDDPGWPKIRLAVNLLVKRDVHASVEAIDMGRFRIVSVRANPSLLDLLRQTVILESRSPSMRITGLESDLPFVTLSCHPEGPAKRVRIDVSLDPRKLTAGEHGGVVRIHTDVKAVPQIVLPVKVTVVN